MTTLPTPPGAPPALLDACRLARDLLAHPGAAPHDTDRARRILDDAILVAAPIDVHERVRAARAQLADVPVKHRGRSWAMAAERLAKAERALMREEPHQAAEWLAIAADDIADACL
jgi:hypothetical protein